MTTPDNPQPPQPTTPAADDLPLAITRAVAAAEQAATPASEPAQPSPGATPTPPAASDAGGGTQPRGPDGKFAPKQGEPVAPAAGAEPAAAQPPDGEPAPTQPKDDYPASWKPTLRDKWGKLDPEVRAEVHRREREIMHGIQATAERAKAATAVLSEFEPYADILESEGISPVAAMRSLLQTAYALRAGGPELRKTTFLQLAQQYGVDLTTGINSSQAQAEAQALTADVTLRSQHAQQEQAQIDYARAVLAQFASQPGHEHFPVVAEIMGNLMATGVTGDLETAYQQACALHPQLRPTIIAAEAKRLTEQQAAEAARRAAAASSVGNTPGAAGGSGAPPQQSGNAGLRASLEAAFERSTR